MDDVAHELRSLREMAHEIISTRKPDVVIGEDYIRRWFVIPRNRFSNVYLHETLRSDDDFNFHDHRADNTSVILSGTYDEHVPLDPEYPGPGCPRVVFTRSAGDVVVRKAAEPHRLTMAEGGRCLSLFITGPQYREWGFHTADGWVQWDNYLGNGPDNYGARKGQMG